MAATRVAVCVPNLLGNGANTWLQDLVEASPRNLQWAGCWLPAACRLNRDSVAALSKWMPVYLGDPLPSTRWIYCADLLRVVDSETEAARLACHCADVVLTWELTDAVTRPALGLPVVLVSHTRSWRPTSLGAVTHLAAVSSVAAEPLRPFGDVTVIPSGISLDRTVPVRSRQEVRRSLGYGELVPIVLVVAQRAYRKNLEFAAKAVSEFDRSAVCLLVGGCCGDDRVQQLASRYRNLRLVGHTDYVGDYVAASDVLLQLSEHEGYGNSIVEAWAAGLPVVAEQQAGVLVDNPEVPVWLATDVRDSRGVGALLRAAVDATPKQRQRMSQYVRDHLTSRQMAGRWLRLFETASQRPVAVAGEDYRTEPVVVPPREAGRRRLKAAFLCPWLRGGGIESWFRSVVRHSVDIDWSVATVSGSSHSDVVADLSGKSELHLLESYDSAEAAVAAAVAGCEVVVHAGVMFVASLLPSDYQGEIVCFSHGVRECDWSRRWVCQGAVDSSHLAACSTAAVSAYPEHLQGYVSVLLPGVETPATVDRRQARQRLDLQDSDITVLYVGRSDENKGLTRVASVVAAMDGAVLLHVGADGGDTEIEAERLLGGRYRRFPFSLDLGGYFSAADVLMLLSDFESFGLVIVEALLSGLPVVTHARTVCGEFAAESWAGVQIVEPTDDSRVIAAAAASASAARPDDQTRSRLSELFSPADRVSDVEDYLFGAVDGVFGRATPGVPMYKLSSSSPWPSEFRPEMTADMGADFVCPLSGDVQQDLTSLSSLRQRGYRSFLHLVGPKDWQQAVLSLAGDVSWRIVGHDRPPASPAAALWQVVESTASHSDYLLLSLPGQVSLPDRAARCVTSMFSAGSDLLYGRLLSGDLDVGATAVRVAAVADMVATGYSPVSLRQLVHRCRREGRSVLRMDLPVVEGNPLPDRCGLPEDWSAATALTRAVPVDVVLPFRDHLDYAMEAVNSVLNMHGDNQLHLIDDSSTDRAAVDEWWRQLPPGVRTYRSVRNIGQFMAVNAVVPYLDREIFLIHDGDDISLPHRSLVTSAVMELSGAGVFSSAARLFGGGPRTLLSVYPFPHSCYNLLNPAAGIRRSEFVRLGGYRDFGSADRNKTSLDTELWLRVRQAGVRVAVSSAELVRYRQHPQSCVHNATTGFASAARQFVERKYAAVCNGPPVKGSLSRCKGLLKYVHRISVADT